MPLGLDVESWDYGIPYRIGYASAIERLDMAGFTNTSHGRSKGNPFDASAIVEEVVGRLGRNAEDPAVGAIREGVEDALGGERPRW